MRTELTTILVAMLASSAAFAACEAPTTHVEQLRCSEREATHLAGEIRAAQQLIRAKIASWDSEREDRARSLTLFNKAASNFQGYQERQCEFEASAAAGGNGAGDMRLDCQLRLGGAYLKALKEQAAWFDGPHA